MIGLQHYASIPTSLDLNGPTLSTTQQPEGPTGNVNDTVTMTGISTATFPEGQTSRATNTGYISYQWHEVGVGALSDTSNISGTATTTITISGIQSPDDDGRQFFLRSDYTPSAYQTSSPVTAGTARSTGNALNDFLDSNIVRLTVNPTLSITTQPADLELAGGQTGTFSVVASSSNSTEIFYQWNVDGVPLTNGNDGTTEISGANSDTLTFNTTTLGERDVTVDITHPTASNSPLTSSSATLIVVDPRQMLTVESVSYGESNVLAPTVTYNLFDSGPVRLEGLSGPRSYSVFAPEKPLNLKITLAAPAGRSRNGHLGGEGGLSTFHYTLPQNEELTVKIGGQYGDNEGDGGGIAVLYMLARTLVICGGGGGAGTSARGGHGGGIGVAGQNGSGRGFGEGARLIEAGTMDLNGSFQNGSQTPNTGRIGGRLSSCTIGGHYRRLGVAPCTTLGTQQIVGAQGQTIQGTASILRGYKPGLGYRNNAGIGDGSRGGGGAGSVGGNAASNGGSGGGGASGYTNGEAEIITTQLGGNSGTGYIIFEVQE
jgi:hypothetical protein